MTSAPAPHHDLGRRLVIVPAYNEADSIAAVIEDLGRHAPGFDVVVIDDGSTDGTASRVPPPAKVITLPFNQGIGGAMQTGYRYAARHGYAVAIQVDGDGQHPASEVPRLVRHLQETGANLVVGSRFLPPHAEPGQPAAGDAPENYRPPPSRMAGIVVLRGLLRLLTGQRITDCTSGFRAADRDLIAAFARWYPDDYPEPEVLVLMHRAGYNFTELPVTMSPRTAGQTSIPFVRGLFYVLKVSTALLLDTVRRPWPDLSRSRGA